MSADEQRAEKAVREAIEALTQRVDTLAGIVREAAGSLAANRGEVASLERRLQERFRQEIDMAGATLASVRGELETLRGVVTAVQKDSGPGPQSPLLDEPVAALGARIDTLAEIVRSTAGRVLLEQSRTGALAAAIARGDERVEARLTEIQRDLEVVASQAAALAAPATVTDTDLERRVADHLGAFETRLDFVVGTASDTAAKLAATTGDLARLEKRRGEELQTLEARSGKSLTLIDETVRSMRGDLEGLKSRLVIDPLLQERVEGLVDSVSGLGVRVGTLSGIVRETAGRVSGRGDEMAALAGRVDGVEARVDVVARELRREIDVLAAPSTEGSGPAVDGTVLDTKMEAFGTQLARLERVVAGVSDTIEEVGAELRAEIAVLSDAVAKEHGDLVEAARKWEAGRSLLEGRLNDVAAFAASTVQRGADEIGRELRTLAERLERLEQDRRAVANDATEANNAWARERAALETRLDAITAATVSQRDPEVERLVGELAARLARMEGEREAVADVAALVGTWTAELTRLEARVEEGLSVLEQHDVAPSGGRPGPELDDGLLVSLDELRERIGRIERDRDHVQGELSRTETAWAEERASLHERFAELANLASSAVERRADEMGRELHTLAGRLERLEQDRQAMANEATHAERAWAEDRDALEARLDAIAAAMTVARPQPAAVEQLVAELAGRLARMEDRRETVVDLAALAETWAAELSALVARVDEGLSALDEQAPAGVDGQPRALDGEVSTSLDELTERIARIERDRDAVQHELTRTATSWAAERASLQERVSELAARIVTGPMPAPTEAAEDGAVAQSPQELDALRIGIEGLRMRLAYHEKTVSELAGSRGVTQRLNELSARVDQLATVVAEGLFQQGPQSEARRIQPLNLETGSLTSRLEEAERERHRSQEKLLDQMEKIATQMNWRLQRLEAAGVEVHAGVN